MKFYRIKKKNQAALQNLLCGPRSFLLSWKVLTLLFSCSSFSRNRRCSQPHFTTLKMLLYTLVPAGLSRATLKLIICFVDMLYVGWILTNIVPDFFPCTLVSASEDPAMKCLDKCRNSKVMRVMITGILLKVYSTYVCNFLHYRLLNSRKAKARLYVASFYWSLYLLPRIVLFWHTFRISTMKR